MGSDPLKFPDELDCLEFKTPADALKAKELLEKVQKDAHERGMRRMVEACYAAAKEERDTPESEGGNMLRYDACDNVMLAIRRAALAEDIDLSTAPREKEEG
jgi:hypothetical protein